MKKTSLMAWGCLSLVVAFSAPLYGKETVSHPQFGPTVIASHTPLDETQEANKKEEPVRGESGVAEEDAPSSGKFEKWRGILTPAQIRNLEATEARIAAADESDVQAAREFVRELAEKRISEHYQPIVPYLDLTQGQSEQLLEFLIEARIASTSTVYFTATPLSREERAEKLTEILGKVKYEHFLELEQTALPAHAHLGKVATLFERRGVSLTGDQHDRLVEIFAAAWTEHLTQRMPDEVVASNDWDKLEWEFAQREAFERQVVALAPTVLTPRQVVYLDQHFQRVAYQRAADLERQKKQRAAHPDIDFGFPWYPPRL